MALTLSLFGNFNGSSLDMLMGLETAAVLDTLSSSGYFVKIGTFDRDENCERLPHPETQPTRERLGTR